MSQPRAISGSFNFRVDSPPVPTGPVVPALGVYSLFPDAVIHIAFNGDVELPPGRWEVGIVQNVWNDRVAIVYSEGGEIYFSQDSAPLLDLARGMTGMWLDTLGNGVKTIDNLSARATRTHVSLDAGDLPTSPPIPGRMTRCNNTITEQLVFAERVLQLIAALVARNRDDGAIYPLAATAGNTYGFMWRLEPAPGAPIFHFKPLFPTAVEMSLPFSLFGPGGVVTTGQTANERGDVLAANALLTYAADCGRRAPRTGDVNLWP